MPAFLFSMQRLSSPRFSLQQYRESNTFFKKVATISLAITSLLLSACSNEQGEASSTPEINSLNIIFAPLASDPRLTGIYSVEPGSQQGALRASHKTGEQFAIELDTDRNKQGYEYLAYVADDQQDSARDAVYLMDYDRDSQGRIRKVFSLPQAICGVNARARNNEQVTDERNRRASTLVHKNSIIIKVATPTNLDCSGPETLNYELKFDFAQEEVKDQLSVAQESFYIRETLVSYRTSNNQERGQVYYLADNLAGTAMLLDENYGLLWSAALPDNAEQLQAMQVDNGSVLIQAGSRAYFRSLDELLDASDPSQNNNGTAIAERVFGPVFYQLQNSDEQNPITFYPDAGGVVIKDGRALLVHNNDRFERVIEFDSEVIGEQIIVSSGSDIAIVMQYQDRAQFVHARRINDQWLSSTQILGGQFASKMSIDSYDKGLIINTTALGGPDQGIQAFYGESFDSSFKRYSNAALLTRTELELDIDSPHIYLLATDASGSAQTLLNPSIYEFDSEQDDGRKLKLGADGNPILDDTGSQALRVSYGQILANIGSYQAKLRFNNRQSAFISYRATDNTQARWFWINPEKPL